MPPNWESSSATFFNVSVFSRWCSFPLQKNVLHFSVPEPVPASRSAPCGSPGIVLILVNLPTKNSPPGRHGQEGCFSRYALQFQPHRDQFLISSVPRTKTFGVSAIFHKSCRLVHGDCSCVLRHYIQLQLSISGGFSTMDTGFHQGLPDSQTPILF